MSYPNHGINEVRPRDACNSTGVIFFCGRWACFPPPENVPYKSNDINKISGRGGGDRNHFSVGNKGVLRRTQAFYVVERKAMESLVPPYCPQKKRALDRVFC